MGWGGQQCVGVGGSGGREGGRQARCSARPPDMRWRVHLIGQVQVGVEGCGGGAGGGQVRGERVLGELQATPTQGNSALCRWAVNTRRPSPRSSALAAAALGGKGLAGSALQYDDACARLDGGVSSQSTAAGRRWQSMQAAYKARCGAVLYCDALQYNAVQTCAWMTVSSPTAPVSMMRPCAGGGGGAGGKGLYYHKRQRCAKALEVVVVVVGRRVRELDNSATSDMRRAMCRRRRLPASGRWLRRAPCRAVPRSNHVCSRRGAARRCMGRRRGRRWPNLAAGRKQRPLPSPHHARAAAGRVGGREVAVGRTCVWPIPCDG